MVRSSDRRGPLGPAEAQMGRLKSGARADTAAGSWNLPGASREGRERTQIYGALGTGALTLFLFEPRW